MEETYQSCKDLYLQEALEEKLNSTKPSVRLTALKICNRKLNIYYIMSLTENSIKSYFFYINKKQVIAIHNKTWHDIKNAIWFFKIVQKASSFEEIKKAYDSLENSKTWNLAVR